MCQSCHKSRFHLLIEYLDTLTLGNNPHPLSPIQSDSNSIFQVSHILWEVIISYVTDRWAPQCLPFPRCQPVCTNTALREMRRSLRRALSLFYLSSKSDEDNLQPIPPSRGTAFHTTAPTPSLFPPTSHTLTTTTNPKLQDAGVNTMVGGGVRRQCGSSVRWGVRMTFLR